MNKTRKQFDKNMKNKATAILLTRDIIKELADLYQDWLSEYIALDGNTGSFFSNDRVEKLVNKLHKTIGNQKKDYILGKVENWIYKMSDKEMDELKEKGTWSETWIEFKKKIK